MKNKKQKIFKTFLHLKTVYLSAILVNLFVPGTYEYLKKRISFHVILLNFGKNLNSFIINVSKPFNFDMMYTYSLEYFMLIKIKKISQAC